MGLIILRVCLMLTLGAHWLAGQETLRVLLVTNTNSPLSRRLGEFYRQWHQLPAQQLCPIRSSTEESISRQDFNAIAQAVQSCLQRHKLVEQIFYILLTQEIPIRIHAEKSGDGASVDSELALLYGRMRGINFPLEGTVENPFYRQRDRPFRHPDFPIYLVTRLAGYSFEDAQRAVMRCREARNKGKVVLDLKADNDEAGNSWLRDAAIFLPADRTVLDVSTQVVAPQKDVIGYASWGSNDRARKSRKSGMEWLPGAIATEFVSSNARTLKMPPYNWTLGNWQDRSTWFAGSPQSHILDYIWEGVSGISGNVDEPYLKWTVRPDVLFPAYLGGRNLAESFYLALPVLSWKALIVGDPLCKLAAPQ